MFFRVLLGITSLASFIIAAPNMLGATWMAIGDPIVADLRAGEPVSPEDIITLVETREAAATLGSWADIYGDLGYAYLIQDQSLENAQRAIAAGRRGVELNPISPYIWQRHASLLAFHQDYHAEGVEAWRTARALGKNVRHLLHDRIRIGTQLYREMTPEDRTELRQDVEQAYALNRSAFRAYGRQMNLIEWYKFLLRDAEKTKYLDA